MRRKGLPAVPEGPAANCGMRTGGHGGTSGGPYLQGRASMLGKPLAARAPGKTAWRLDRKKIAWCQSSWGHLCHRTFPFARRMEGSFPAPSPWGASGGCEACGVCPRDAQTLRNCCYSAVTGSDLFWGRGSLGWLGLSLERTMVILWCDWRGGFMLASVGDMRGRKHMLGVAVLNTKCQNCNWKA